MTRIRISIALVAVLAFTVAAVAPARGTTGPGYQFVIGVRLHNTGVAFTKGHVPRGTPCSSSSRTCRRSRATSSLADGGRSSCEPSQREIFFLGFEYRGKFPYRSWGPNAKQFRGTFVVT